MSRNIYVISDTHFGHDNILRFKRKDGSPVRPFTSTQDMNDVIIQNWNSIVRDCDIVYHLGDVYFGQGHKVLPNLKGRKRLILGNHDDGKCKYLQQYFQKIMVWRNFPEFNCVLSHVPLHESSLNKVQYNIHGHIHEKQSPSPRHINCSVEVTGYKPVNIEDLIKR